MKKMSFIPVTLLLLWLSCGDPVEKLPDILEINTEKLEFNESAGYKYINLSTSARWKIEVSDGTWLECSPADGTGNERVKI